MWDTSVNAPLKAQAARRIFVWFNGATAILEGQALAYDYAYNAPATPAGAVAETAASVDYRRYNQVVAVDAAHSNWFAGVAASAYPASATGQLIEIYLPGSVCKVLAKANLVIGVGRVTFQVGGTYSGYFTREGFAGAGSARPLQTKDTSSTVGLVEVLLEEGAQSGGVEVLTPTGTAGGALQAKVGGVTYYQAATNASAVLTSTLADGTVLGEKKGIVIEGTQTTHGVTVTVTTGFKIDQTTSITTITGSTAGRRFIAEWLGNAWYTRVDTFDTIS